MSMLLDNKKGELANKFEEYLAKDQRFSRVVEAVKKDFDESGLTAHNWEHIFRDALNAIVIGEKEGADMEIVMPAIVMHDIGFLYGATGKTHGAIGADKLPEFLSKHGIDYNKEEQEKLASCIRTHKGSMHNEAPESLEAKVVADADLLEKFGPLGVYQYIRTFTEFNKPLEDIISRKDSISTLSLETKTGKEIAERGRQYVSDFFESLDRAQDIYREENI
jgi:uncharacterized protein